jgi:hypothetical protein
MYTFPKLSDEKLFAFPPSLAKVLHVVGSSLGSDGVIIMIRMEVLRFDRVGII